MSKMWQLICILSCVNAYSMDNPKDAHKESHWVLLAPSRCINALCDTARTSEHNLRKASFERGPGFWSNPKDEADKSFFGTLTDPKSQRENWYKVSPYIAEFWCALSNIGFIYVGLKYNSPELVFAGVASIVSHSIPKQWLLTVDKIGVALVLSKAVREYSTFASNPWLLAPLAIAGTINMSDAYLARNYAQTWPHVVWHLSSAALASEFLKQIPS
jgi:hypothetical protein